MYNQYKAIKNISYRPVQLILDDKIQYNQIRQYGRKYDTVEFLPYPNDVDDVDIINSQLNFIIRSIK